MIHKEQALKAIVEANVESKYYNKIDGKNIFDQPIKDSKSIYENKKIAPGQGDDYTACCLLDYPFLKDSYRMIAIDLSKQQALDADLRAIQQTNFAAELDRAGNTRIWHKNSGLFTRNCKNIVNML